MPSSYFSYQVMLFAVMTTAYGLDCYSCDASPGPACLGAPQVTCSDGQVCSNLVYRRGYSLGVLYTKGCEDETICVHLENLNTPSYCDHAPSQCHHCCYENLCNNSRVFRFLFGVTHSWLYLGVSCMICWYLVLAVMTHHVT